MARSKQTANEKTVKSKGVLANAKVLAKKAEAAAAAKKLKRERPLILTRWTSSLIIMMGRRKRKRKRRRKVLPLHLLLMLQWIHNLPGKKSRKEQLNWRS